jgi:hypothetical protein
MNNRFNNISNVIKNNKKDILDQLVNTLKDNNKVEDEKKGYGDLSSNPVSFGSVDEFGVPGTPGGNFQSDYLEKIGRYAAGLMDPEYATRLGIQIKQPSILTIPSVTITQRSSNTILPSTGKFWLTWNPCFFCDAHGLKGIDMYNGADRNAKIPVNYTSSIAWGAETSIDSPINVIKDPMPTVNVAKVRLVSAKLRITYRGSLEKQAGKFIGCATYQPFPVLVGNYNEDEPPKDSEGKIWSIKSMIAKATNLPQDEVKVNPVINSFVLNGVWAKQVPLTPEIKSIVCTYIPTDPSEQIFGNPGTYRGFPVDGKASTPDPNNVLLSLNSTYGGGLGFIIVGDGLDNTQNIDVETFYNWEVIPEIGSASVMKNYADGTVDPSAYNQLMKMYAPSSFSIRPESASQTAELQQAGYGAWKDILRKIASVASFIGDNAMKLLA